jgi:hypothetical protein
MFSCATLTLLPAAADDHRPPLCERPVATLLTALWPNSAGDERQLSTFAVGRPSSKRTFAEFSKRSKD